MTSYPQEVTFALKGTKVLAGRPFLPGDHFAFEVEGSDGAPMPSVTRVDVRPTAGQLAAIDFGTVGFREEHAGRTYTYTVREVFEDAAGFSYDTPRQVVRVKVGSAPGEGLQLSVSYGENGEGRAMVFSSRYSARGVAEVNAVKDLQGRDWTERDSFEFVIGAVARGTYKFGAYQLVEGGAGIPMPMEAKVAVTRENREIAHRQHVADPWRIPFSISDLHVDPVDGIMKGDFFYEMKEVLPAGAVRNANGTRTHRDLLYSNDVHSVHVAVEDNRRGELAVTVTYDESERGDGRTAIPSIPVFASVSMLPAPVPDDNMRLVAFVDGVSGATLRLDPVPAGSAVEPPEPPEHPGYVFRAWVGVLENIENPGVVVATYLPDFDALRAASEVAE